MVTIRYIPGLRPQPHLVPSRIHLVAIDRVNSDLRTKMDTSKPIAPLFRHQHRQPFIGDDEPRLLSPSPSSVDLVLDTGKCYVVDRNYEDFQTAARARLLFHRSL